VRHCREELVFEPVQLLLGRHVAEHVNRAGERAAIVPNRRAGRRDHDLAPVAAADPLLRDAIG
jgi:hypothetical protein